MVQIDAATADAHTANYPIISPPFRWGKSKELFDVRNKPGLTVVLSKDDLTADNGKLHATIRGKGILANKTTCNVFTLLRMRQLPLAFVEIDNVNTFVAKKCRMIPLEVVTRIRNDGSLLKRCPDLVKHELLPDPVVELYLKTSGQRWKGMELACDDPLMEADERNGHIRLYRPNDPIATREPFDLLSLDEIFDEEGDADLIPEMQELALTASLELMRAWATLGYVFVDCKIEFGITPEGELVIADVIDNDSWRLLHDGQHVDKQLFRNRYPLEEVEAAYKLVAEASEALVLC